MRFSALLIFVVVLVPQGAAAEDDPREKPVLDLMNHYAQSAGALASCGKGPADKEIQPLANRIAEWKFPGVLGWLGSSRNDYAKKTAADAHHEYVLASAKPCNQLFVSSTELLLRSAKAEIERVANSE